MCSDPGRRAFTEISVHYWRREALHTYKIRMRQHSNRKKHRNLQRTTQPGTRRDDKQIYNITSSQHNKAQPTQQTGVNLYRGNKAQPSRYITQANGHSNSANQQNCWTLTSSSNAFLTDKLVKVQGSGKEQECRSLRLHVQGQARLMMKPETTHQRTRSESSSATPLWETDQSSFLQLSQALFNTTMHHHLYYMLHTS